MTDHAPKGSHRRECFTCTDESCSMCIIEKKDEEIASLRAELDAAWKAAAVPVRGMVSLAEVITDREEKRDEAQARFSTLWAFLEWVRTRDWTIAQLDERARDLHDEGPAEIGINVVAEREELREALKDAVGHFAHPCHPGRAAFKAMADKERVDRWRALAYRGGR